MIWVGIGGFIYKEKPELLPMTTDKCVDATILNPENFNSSYEEKFTHLFDSKSSANLSNFIVNMDDVQRNLKNLTNINPDVEDTVTDER